VATVLGLLIALFGPLLIAVMSERLTPASNRLVPHLLGQAALLVVVASVLLIVLRWEKQPLSSLGVHAATWQSPAWGLALAAFFMYAFAPVASSGLRRLKLRGFDAGLAKLAGLPVRYLILAVLIGGASEDLLYRGYAIDRVASLTGSYRLGGLVPVCIFGLAHAPTWGWGPALTTLGSGGILTLFYIWQQDSAANVLAHVPADLAGLVLMPPFARNRA